MTAFYTMCFVAMASMGAVATGYLLDRLRVPKPVFWLVAIVYAILVYMTAGEL